jgi:hypothetical protein
MAKKTAQVPPAELSAEELTLKVAELESLNEANESKIKEQEAEIEDLKSQLKVDSTSDDSKPEPGVEFEFENQKYQFTDDAPKTIFVNGKGVTQEKIAEDEDLALQLIGGGSGLIKKI